MNNTSAAQERGAVHARVLALVLAAATFLTCSSSIDKTQTSQNRLVLPCGLGDLRLGVTTEEFTRLRPGAKRETSDRGYSEQISGCLPYIDVAHYDLSWGQLRGVVLRRGWDIGEGPEELNSLIPSLLAGAVELWGRPSEFGFSEKTWGSEHLFKTVVIIWTGGGSTVIMRFPPADTIEEAVAQRNHAVPLEIRIALTSGIRTWTSLGVMDFTASASLQDHYLSLARTSSEATESMLQ